MPGVRPSGSVGFAGAPDQRVMSDRATLAGIAIGSVTVQALGLIVLARMLREAQHPTRAAAGLVNQEGE